MAQDHQASKQELPPGMRTQAQPLSPAELSAVSHAEADKAPYGRRWSRKTLIWTVLNSVPQENGNIRVTLTYRPEGPFGGRPGEEVVTITPNGELLDREQAHSPQEAFPWLLSLIASLSVIVAIVAVFMLMANKDETGDPLYVSGRYLWMRVGEPVLVDKIHYTVTVSSEQVAHFEITRQNENTVLAIIDVTLINQLTNQVLLAIDSDAAELVTNSGIATRPFDVIEQANRIDSVDSQHFQPEFLPLGSTVTLNKGEQLVGKMIFEVPIGTEFKEFRWRASDTMTARYS